MTTSKTRLLNY